jgi:hypothetical protein
MRCNRAENTDQERAREIARLEAERDRLLESAPRAFVARRGIALCFLGMVVVVLTFARSSACAKRLPRRMDQEYLLLCMQAM